MTSSVNSAQEKFLREYERAAELCRQGSPEEAVEIYSRMIKHFHFSLLYNQRAIAFAKLKDFESALLDIDEAIRLDEDDPECRVNKGAILLQLKRFQEAVTELSAALSMDPANLQALNNRGVAYEELGDLELAAADFRAALEIDRCYSSAQQNLRRIESGR